MPRDSEATRARILEAAITEFSAVGFSGARIERISERSGANKRMIYVYYTDKEGLFTATLNEVITKLVSAVTPDHNDLPGYAGSMFDYLIEHPEAVRIAAWRQLERPTTGPQTTDIYAQKVAAIRAPDLSETAKAIPPTDLLILVQGMAGAWLHTPAELLTHDGSDPQSPQRLASHRAALVEAVRRIVAG
ncbi:TetR family transcriptional regulator [Streptomyces sp. NBC_01622]|uniref:TetR family transcriptional regulator n=1 Tax=Streptomyces sp. NBC_01622 TaxID=2975903 RepID=UPI00386C0A82|nr:TetR family transcriptional regulator [Streptomyces sp. NBC_01622]